MPAHPRPNLFVIGAMKAGTTSLHHYLASHPRVFMCEPKEPNYFVEELNWRRGEAWYLDLFARAGDATVIGESSTEYTKLPTYRGVAERVHAFNPGARLVYLVRDPVERVISHYWHNVNNVYDEGERRGLREAVERDARYLAYSDYALQLEPWLARFGREQLALVTTEALASDPVGTLASLCTWLGLEPSLTGAELQGRWNVRPAAVSVVRGWGGSVLARLRRSAFWQALGPLAPPALREAGARLAATRVPADDAGRADAVAFLRPLLRDRTDVFARQLQRSFPEWTTLYGAEAGTVVSSPRAR